MCGAGVRVCMCVGGGRGGAGEGGIPLYKQQFVKEHTISFSISNRSCENSQPAVQLLLSMSSALRYFHDMNSVVTD